MLYLRRLAINLFIWITRSIAWSDLFSSVFRIKLFTSGKRFELYKQKRTNFFFHQHTIFYVCLCFVCFDIVLNLFIVELQILPNDTTIYGTNGTTVTLTCLIKNNIQGTKNISWLQNGQFVNSNASNILTATFLLTTEVRKQNVKCVVDIDCIDMHLEQNVKFSVNCTYNRSFL